MKRFGHVIKIKKEKLGDYKTLHANPWPEVNATLKRCNIQNYSIYHYGDYLFSYYEYVGENYQADMLKMNECKVTKEWWSLTDPCQEAVEDAKENEWWKALDEVFHLD